MNIYFKTGCMLFDKVIGGNKNVYGVPAGKIINIVGDKSSGKTFLSNEFIAWAYHNYGDKFKWVYDDCESGYSFDTKSMYGFEIMPMNIEDRIHSETVEDAFCNISNFANELEKDEFGIYVLDSLDGLTSYEQDERAEERLKKFNEGKKFEKGTMGMDKQKYLSQEFFPQLCSIVEKKNVLVIIVSQIRENVNPYSFEKYKRSGGKGIDFYAHSVIWLATLKKIEKKDTPIGVVVKAKTTKSKTPRPFRECFFLFLYDYGLDNIGSNIDYLFDLRTPQGELNAKAKSIQWDSDKEISKDDLFIFLNENDLLDKYHRKYKTQTEDYEEMLSFIQSKKDYRDMYKAMFGDSMSREELISYIEDNNLEEELDRRVDEKWETFEDSIKSKRKKRYATQE